MSTVKRCVFKGYGLFVSDVDEAQKYYENFGLKVKGRRAGLLDNDVFLGTPAHKYRLTSMDLVSNGAELELLELEVEGRRVERMDNANPGTSHVCWYVNSLQKAWEVLHKEGVEMVSSSLVDVPNGPMEGGRAVYLHGYDDSRVELLEGEVYLDLSRRPDLFSALPEHTASEFSHLGVHVTSLEKSLPFYRDILGLELVAEWFIDEEYVKKVVGYPTVKLNMALFRLPGTDAFLEVIEYQDVAKQAILNGPMTLGACKLIFTVESLDSFLEGISAGDKPQDLKEYRAGMRATPSALLRDPDGILIELIEQAR